MDKEEPQEEGTWIRRSHRRSGRDKEGPQEEGTMSHPPRPQAEKLVPCIPADAYGSNRPLKTLC
jgi:hypothetical protein